MYDLAKKGREAMKSKARRLAGEKVGKVDSSDWSPAELLNGDVKTGMRPISRRAYKTGGKVMGEECAPRADRKPRKAGGKADNEKAESAQYAKAKVNRDVKAANEQRPGIKHVGALKTGGRAKKQHGGSNPGSDAIGDLIRRDTTPVPAPDRRPLTPAEAGIRPGPGAYETEREENAAAFDAQQRRNERAKPQNRKAGGRTSAKTEKNPAQAKMHKAPVVKPSSDKPTNMSTMANDNAKAGGGYVSHGTARGKPVIPGMKKGGRTKKLGGGALMGGILPAIAMGGMGGKDKDEGKKAGGRIARKSGGRAKGKTNINIVINTKPTGDAAAAPGLDAMTAPAGMRPPGGVPVPVPSPAPGGMPMPMPMPMPAGGPPGGPNPLMRRRGGKVYRSYKDMDAGAGSGLGRLEKTEIQSRK